MSYLLQHLIASPPLVEATAGETSRRLLPGVSKVRGTCLNFAQTNPNGCVAACGLAQGADLNTSVMPFILRGVTLVGVNSVYEPYARRKLAWDRIASDLDPEKLEQMTQIVSL